MKKILFILDNLDGGGAERVFVNIANGFVENNISVEFLTGKKAGTYLGHIKSGYSGHGSWRNIIAKIPADFPRIFKKTAIHIFLLQVIT
jgi:hypothetical protein